MSIDFSACQYENAFLPHKLQNYQLPKGETKRPDRQEGFTTVIANDRGHLLPGQPRSRESPWGSFVSTWDMPDKLPVPSRINPTARREDVVQQLQTDKFEKEMIISGKLKRCKVPPPLKVMGDIEATAAATVADVPPPASTGSRNGAQAPCPATTMDQSTNAEPLRNGTSTQHWPQPPVTPVKSPVGVSRSPKPPTPQAVIPSPKPATPQAAAASPKPPTPQAMAPEPELAQLGAGSPAPAEVDWPMPKSASPAQV